MTDLTTNEVVALTGLNQTALAAGTNVLISASVSTGWRSPSA